MLANEFDAWHNTVKNLFDKHDFLDHETDQEEEKAIFLFINPTIINEITHLAGKPFEQYKENHPSEDLSAIDLIIIIDNIVDAVKKLIENEVLLVIDGNKETVLKQIELYKDIGSADTVNVSIANEFGLNFLTVDIRLANKIYRNRNKLLNIDKVYFTATVHKTY